MSGDLTGLFLYIHWLKKTICLVRILRLETFRYHLFSVRQESNCLTFNLADHLTSINIFAYEFDLFKVVLISSWW